MRSLVLLFAFLAGCGGTTYLEVGAGYNGSINNTWEDADTAGFYGSLRQEWDQWVCHYSHYSQWLAGPPFNDRNESALDHFGCAYRWKIH